MHDKICDTIEKSPPALPGCTNPQFIRNYVSSSPAGVGAQTAPTCKDFVDYLDQIAMCGRQHIFLFSPTSEVRNLCQELANPDYLQKLIFQTMHANGLSETGQIQEFSSFVSSPAHSEHLNGSGFSFCLWESSGPFLAEAKHIPDHDGQPHCLSLKWVETRRYNKTKTDPHGTDAERSVNFLLVDLTDGSAQLRLQLLRSRPVKTLQEEFDLYAEELKALNLWEKFTPVFLAPLIRRFLYKGILPITASGIRAKAGDVQVSRAPQHVIKRLLLPFSHFSPRPIRLYWQCHQRSHNDARLYFTLNGFNNSITFSGVTDRPRVNFITHELYQARGLQNDLEHIFINELKDFASHFPDNSQLIYLIDYHFGELGKYGISSTELQVDTTVDQDKIEKVFSALADRYPNNFFVMNGVGNKVLRRRTRVHTIRMAELRSLAEDYSDDQLIISAIDYRFTTQDKRGINSRQLASEEGFDEIQVKQVFNNAAKNKAPPPLAPRWLQPIWPAVRNYFDRVVTHLGRHNQVKTPAKPKKSHLVNTFDKIAQGRKVVLLLSRYTSDIKMEELKNVPVKSGIVKRMISVIDHEISKLGRKQLHSGDFAKLTGFSEKSIQNSFRQIVAYASSLFEADEEDNHVVLLVNGYASRIQDVKLNSIAKNRPADGKIIYVIDYHFSILKLSGLHSEQFAKKEGFDEERVRNIFHAINTQSNGRFQAYPPDNTYTILLATKHLTKKPGGELQALGDLSPEAEKMIRLMFYYFRKLHRVGLNSMQFARETGMDKEKLKKLFLQVGELSEFTTETVGDNVILSLRCIVDRIVNRKLRELAQRYQGDSKIIAAIDHEFGGILKMILSKSLAGVSLWTLVLRLMLIRRRELPSDGLCTVTGYQKDRIREVFSTVATEYPGRYDATEKNEHIILTRKTLFYEGWIDRPLRSLEAMIKGWLPLGPLANQTNLARWSHRLKIQLARLLLHSIKLFGVILVVAVPLLVEQGTDYLVKQGIPSLPGWGYLSIKIFLTAITGIQYYGWRRVEDRLIKTPMKGVGRAVGVTTGKSSDIKINAQAYEKWLRGRP
jgi:hypothetical protein